MRKPDQAAPLRRLGCITGRARALTIAGAAAAAVTVAAGSSGAAENTAGPGEPGTLHLPRLSAEVPLDPGTRPYPLPLTDIRALLHIETRPEHMGTRTRRADGTQTEAPVNLEVRSALAAAVPDTALQGLRTLAPGQIEPVADTSRYPERAAGLLVARFGPVSSYCSGTLIGPATVLTAAHCVYDHATGWADDIAFAPGLNGDSPPFGLWDYAAAHVPTGFVTAYRGDYASVVGYDLAVITLAEPAGATLGWFGFGFDASGAGRTVSMLAYPGDRPLGTQWRAVCEIHPLAEAPVSLAAHRCPVASGSSGGAMAAPGQDGTPDILGVTVATTPEHALAVTLGLGQAAWISGLWR